MTNTERRTVSLDALRDALDRLDEPSACAGEFPVDDRLALLLPGGEACGVGDPDFVRWLVAHAEPAPFGQGGATRVDPAVRRALRLRARGRTQVAGFDPAAVLDEVESALSPREHLVAVLTDVLVYPTGGHFLPHKDTPRGPELLGTLVVALPVAHEGGALEVEGGDAYDWGGPADPTRVRWAALYGDVDHRVAEVTAGTRVTLVYALQRTGRDRRDADWSRRFADVDACARRLEAGELPVMIPCTRHVVAPDDATELPREALRGADRELAGALARAGFTVRVRVCLAAREGEDGTGPLPPRLRARGWKEVCFARVVRPLTDDALARTQPCVTFVRPCGDGGGYLDDDVTSLERDVDASLPDARWLVRRAAAATFVRALEFAGDGYVGNAAYEAFLYRLAALEVTR